LNKQPILIVEDEPNIARLIETYLQHAGFATTPAPDLPHIFERFYRVERARSRETGGAGIGLAIVRELAEAHSGQVGASSGDGWTRVWIELPEPPVAPA